MDILSHPDPVCLYVQYYCMYIYTVKGSMYDLCSFPPSHSQTAKALHTAEKIVSPAAIKPKDGAFFRPRPYKNNNKQDSDD